MRINNCISMKHYYWNLLQLGAKSHVRGLEIISGYIKSEAIVFMYSFAVYLTGMAVRVRVPNLLTLVSDNKEVIPLSPILFFFSS